LLNTLPKLKYFLKIWRLEFLRKYWLYLLINLSKSKIDWGVNKSNNWNF